MEMENPETGEITYEFPVTLYNRSGGVYAVGSLAELRYHLDNGWSVNIPEQDLPPITTSIPEHLNNLGMRFRDSEAAIASLVERMDALDKRLATTYASLTTAHSKIAKLTKELSA